MIDRLDYDDFPLERPPSPTVKRLVEQGSKRDPRLTEKPSSLDEVVRRKKWVM